MIGFEQIQAVSFAIAAAFKPEQIILFGSYAYGTPTPDSDVDLLVVMPFEDHEAKQALRIRQSVKLPFPADLVVRSPEQLRQRMAGFCARLWRKAASSMQLLTAEWVNKAEGDFVTATREHRARRAPNYDAACFHAQ